MMNVLAPLMVNVGRAELTQAVTGAGYLLLSGMLLWVSADHGFSRPLVVAAVVVAVAGAAFAWYLSNRRWHLIHDTPTTRVRSAAQGFVELTGTAHLSPGQAPLVFNGLPPCVWFQVVVTDPANTWTRISDETFALRDETGECIIDPDHAEVHMAHVKRWRLEGSRYHARYLMEGDPLYAIGALETLRPLAGGLDRRADVADLLRRWKRDPKALARQYDRDGDGQVDPNEWQHAVKDAERIVDEQHKDLHQHPDIHVMRAPGGNLPFVLSNQDPERLARRFRHWSWFHGLVFLAGLAMGGWLAIG